jgi:PIN domain nuclease of toxin-antitoxin system
LRLLLDTHIWLWSRVERHRLSPLVLQSLANQENELWLSPLSIFELILAHSKGRLVLKQPLAEWLSGLLETAPVVEAPVTNAVARETHAFTLSHGDPIDKLLVATARVFELTLVTADRSIIRSQAVPVLSNR